MKNDYFDRETRTFIFDEQRGTIFYELIVDTLEKVESTFFNDLSDEEDEEEQESLWGGKKKEYYHGDNADYEVMI